MMVKRLLLINLGLILISCSGKPKKDNPYENEPNLGQRARPNHEEEKRKRESERERATTLRHVGSAGRRRRSASPSVQGSEPGFY